MDYTEKRTQVEQSLSGQEALLAHMVLDIKQNNLPVRLNQILKLKHSDFRWDEGVSLLTQGTEISLSPETQRQLESLSGNAGDFIFNATTQRNAWAQKTLRDAEISLN